MATKPPADALPHTWFAVDPVPGDPASTAWKRRSRAHRAAWRMARGYPIGTHPHGHAAGTPVGSRLELGFARESTSNFLTPGARAAVRRRLESPERHEMLQATRLWADLLSSMPPAVARYRAVLRDETTFGWLALEEMLGERSPLGDGARAAVVERYLPGPG